MKRRMPRKTTITIETTSLLVLQSRTSRRGWCPGCNAEQEMLVLENPPSPDAPLTALLSSGVHRTRAPDGTPLICLHSLLALAQRNQTGPQE